jgi:hypothetical protein
MGQHRDAETPHISEQNCGGNSSYCSLFQMCRITNTFQCRACKEIFDSSGERFDRAYTNKTQEELPVNLALVRPKSVKVKNTT